MRLHQKWAAAVAGVAMVTATVVAAPSASAVTTPPWEPDTHALGTLSFYDASGNQITGGTDLNHLFDYAAASTDAARTGTTKASLFWGVPDHTKADSRTWFSSSASAASTFPDPTAPGSLGSLGRHPLAHPGPNDVNLNALIGVATLDSTAGYANLIQIRLKDSGPGIGFQDSFWDADISYDSAAGTWTQVYPAPPVFVDTSVAAITASPVSPAPASTTSVSLTSTVSATDASHPAGTVELFNGATDLGPATFDAATGAVSATATVATGGSYSFSFAFTPTDTSTYHGSTSAALAYSVAPSAPGAPTGVTAVAHNASATVSWVAPTVTGGRPITGYDIQYSSDGGTTYASASAAFHTSTLLTQTVGGLTNGKTYVFRVAAINAVGPGTPSAPSGPVTPTADASTLVISGSATVRYNTAATLSAKLTDSVTHGAIAGQTLVLHRRASASAPWATVRGVATASTGVATTTLALTANTQFYFSYGGAPTHKAVNSAVKAVTVSQVVAVSRSASTVRRGTTVKIYGTVAPAGTGQVVYLQRFYSGAWHTLAVHVAIKSQRLPNGRVAVGYVLPIKLATPATYTFRVYKPATSTLIAGYSAPTAVRAT